MVLAIAAPVLATRLPADQTAVNLPEAAKVMLWETAPAPGPVLSRTPRCKCGVSEAETYFPDVSPKSLDGRLVFGGSSLLI
jgi:hypothetical protein